MPDRICVLVVEDEAIIRVDLANELEDAGYEVIEAESADEAIKLLTLVPRIRLMITDVDMPGSMDGLKLAAAVRERWPPVSIIVVSGHRNVELTNLPAGSAFFSKPYRLPTMLRTARQMLAA